MTVWIQKQDFLLVSLSQNRHVASTTLRRPWPAAIELVRANYQSKLPVVLSAAEVRRLLAAVPALDHRVCLSLIYSCGLRLGEGLGLQVSVRHRWKTRAAAFDHNLASAASLAFEQLARSQTADLKERIQLFRVQEWQLCQEMLHAAAGSIRQLRKHPGRVHPNDLVKLLNLTSILGRRACGLPLDSIGEAEPEPPTCSPSFEEALRKVFGPNEAPEPAQPQVKIP